MLDIIILEAVAKVEKLSYWVVRFAPKSAPIEKLHIDVDGETVEYNPFTDNEQALLLAVNQCIFTDHYETFIKFYCECSQTGLSPVDSTRRAIVLSVFKIQNERNNHAHN